MLLASLSQIERGTLTRIGQPCYLLQESAGDSRIWPFFRRSDYDRALEAAASDTALAPSWASSQRLRSMPPP
jgi:hypothetical protein